MALLLRMFSGNIFTYSEEQISPSYLKKTGPSAFEIEEKVVRKR
jgi:hypothetical protein